MCHIQKRGFYVIVNTQIHIFPSKLPPWCREFCLTFRFLQCFLYCGMFSQLFYMQKTTYHLGNTLDQNDSMNAGLGHIKVIWWNPGNRRPECWIRKRHSRWLTSTGGARLSISIFRGGTPYIFSEINSSVQWIRKVKTGDWLGMFWRLCLLCKMQEGGRSMPATSPLDFVLPFKEDPAALSKPELPCVCPQARLSCTMLAGQLGASPNYWMNGMVVLCFLANSCLYVWWGSVRHFWGCRRGDL